MIGCRTPIRRFGWPTRLILAMWPCFLVGQPLNNFKYFYDAAGQLMKVLDSSGNELDYTIDVSGNIVQITRRAAPAAGALAILKFPPIPPLNWPPGIPPPVDVPGPGAPLLKGPRPGAGGGFGPNGGPPFTTAMKCRSNYGQSE